MCKLGHCFMTTLGQLKDWWKGFYTDNVKNLPFPEDLLSDKIH